MKLKLFFLVMLCASALVVACTYASGNPETPHFGSAINLTFGGDLDGSMVSQRVVGIEGNPIAPPPAGEGGVAIEWDGAALYWGTAGGSVSPGSAGQVLATNDAGAATTWVYPHGDVDASATDPGGMTVNAIQGFGVSNSTPSTGSTFVFSSGLWRPGDLLALFSGVTPEKFGALGNCSTNDNAAFVSALATGLPVWLSAKCYVVTGFTIANAGQSIIGLGQQSILKTTTNGPLITIRADSGATKTLLRDFKVLGSGAGASQVAIANGISSIAGSGDGRAVIDNLSFESTGGDSIQLFNQDTTNAGDHIGTRITNSRFDLCGGSGSGYCIDVQTGAEYVSVSQPSIYGGHSGIYIGAGNFVGGGSGNIDACGFAIEIGAVANDAHGIISGWNINHNAHAVYAHGNLNGFDFVGDHMFYGDIILGDSGGDGSVGLAFIGGQIDVTDIYFEGSTGVKFLGVTWPSANANTMHASYTYASTQWFDGMNVDYTGATPSFITTISAPSFANPALRWAAGVSAPTIAQAAPASDVATQNLTIQPQSPYASASSNKSPGNLVFNEPAPVSTGAYGSFLFQGGGTTNASIESQFGRLTAGGGGSNFKAILGPTPGSETTSSNLYLLPTATTPTAGNYSLHTDGTFLYVSDIFGSGIYFYSAGSTQTALLATSGLFLGGFSLNLNTGATPSVLSGTTATLLTVGTDKTGAVTQLVGDLEANVAKLTTSFEHQTFVAYDSVSTPGAPASTQRNVYVDASNRLVAQDNLGNITVLAP